jgi:hypothetical protein
MQRNLTLMPIMIALILSGCANSGAFRSGELYGKVDPGIYQLSQCSKAGSIGRFTKTTEAGKNKIYYYCISGKNRHEAWAYLWVNPHAEPMLCFKMAGYAAQDNGVSEVGRRLENCHELRMTGV